MIDLCQIRPNIARMYDALLGGKDSYQADRDAVVQVLKVFPSAPVMARTNRAFMHRAIGYLARDWGIRQFLDIGTGFPTELNLHQVAQEVAPESRVVYVDNDPTVLVHARALLISHPAGHVDYIAADATFPADILTAPELLATLDLSEPVAVSLIALLHFIPDDRDPYGLVRALMDAVVPGSVLVISHATPDFDPDGVAAAVEIYHRNGLTSKVRTHNDIMAFFDGLELIDPGIVPPHRWRPAGIEPAAGMDAKASLYAGLAVKTGCGSTPERRGHYTATTPAWGEHR
ncbi:SAM-dependent methyltransferase [Nocardia sp. NPDC049220]|uniref:SAM-dependent methyltransferase n=1 Tax=Nocardia sp. NPDC049220 TaxID=3155273 RepID=UPI0033C670F6